jgi:nucleotide-binding universal stress UspA family protein
MYGRTSSSEQGRHVGGGGSFRRLLVGYDGSHDAQRALRAATALARGLNGEVHVLVALRRPAHTETPAELARAVDAEKTRLTRGLAEAGGEGLPLHIVDGDDPAGALAEHAERHGFDLLVVGAHGSGSATHRGVGHCPEALVRHHPCPVVVV